LPPGAKRATVVLVSTLVMLASLRRLSLLWLVLLDLTALQAAKEHKETLFLFENRQVVFVMPPGFGFSSSKNEQGIFTVHISDAKSRVALQMTFLPDAQSQLSDARSRKEFIFQNFQDRVEPSVEKAMQFQELEPKTGAGTYCVLTDETLAGKKKMSKDEFQHSTIGLKTWPGVAAVFTVSSNGTATKEYQTLLTMLRESVQEVPRT
jgi:hypothetical protein